MPSWDVRLLTGSYDRDTVTLELFGKTRKGQSITMLYKGFRPYFHLLAEKRAVDALLEGDPDVFTTQEQTLFHEGEDRTFTRVTVRLPYTVPGYRKKFSEFGIRAFSADIPFHHRFIYDMDLSSCVRVNGLQVEPGKYRTDLVVEAQEFGECENFNPELRVLSFDIENSISTGEVYCICCALSDGQEENYSNMRIALDSEAKIIEAFVEHIIESDPDVITGYNIDGYDIPHLLERGRKRGVRELNIGRDSGAVVQAGKRFWRARGRIIADAWWNVKMEVRPKQETLAYVSENLLGETKHDVDPRKMDAEWKDNREKVIEYCLQDAVLALKLLKHIRLLNKKMDLATVSKLPLDDALNGRTSTFIDSILIRKADRAGIAVPLTGSFGSKDKPIEGGYVATIQAGLYNWVNVLDFKSMYPSIIIANNICFSTLDPEGEIIAPSGVRYVSSLIRKGLLPGILTNLMEERDAIKKRMKEAKDPRMKAYHNGLQEAVKVLMNAFYGVFASSFYRFTKPIIGASITAFARHNIKLVISQLGQRGLDVIYSDTDSIFFLSPVKNLEGSINIGLEIADEFSKKGAILEFEKILEPFFSHGMKKRYVGKIVWPEPGMIVRGYETRRTDAFELQSASLENIFSVLLGENPDDVINLARNTVSKLQTGSVEIQDLVISRTVKDLGNDSRSHYKEPNRMANVQAARKYEAQGYEFMPGMKIAWVVTDSKRKPMEVEPYIEGREFKFAPDYEYYARRVALTLSRVTDYFGWDERALLAGRKQASLFDSSFGLSTEIKAQPTTSVEKANKEKEKEKAQKAARGQLTLDDIM